MAHGAAVGDADGVGNLLVLALGAAVYPTLLALVLVVLTRPRPAHLLAAFLAGAFIVGIGCGLILVFVLEGAFDTGTRRNASPWVDIAVGVLSLGLAALLATGRDPRPQRLRKRQPAPAKPPRESWTKRAASRDSLRMAFVLGIVLDLPSFWYLVALKDIANGHYSTGGKVLLILAFNVIMFSLAEIPLIYYLLDPDGAQVAIGRFNAWLRAHARQLTEVVAGGIGAYLVVKGIVAL